MPKHIEMVGKQYGRLTVIADAGYLGRDRAVLCRCMCGREKVARSICLRRGDTLSCGCLRQENSVQMRTTHGQAGTRLHKIWKGIRKRCHNEKCHNYGRYGGRGITICPEWDDFAAFEKWSLANGYQDWLTIDRKNNDECYSPENCRWATRHQQVINTSRNTDFPGVMYLKKIKRWQAFMCVNNERVLCKCFETKQEAINARLEAEKQYGVFLER